MEHKTNDYLGGIMDLDLLEDDDLHLRMALAADSDREDEYLQFMDCCICFTASSDVPLPCRHSFCSECLMRYSQEQIRSGVPNPKCPETSCQRELPQNLVKELILRGDDHHVLDLYHSFHDTSPPSSDFSPVKGLMELIQTELDNNSNSNNSNDSNSDNKNKNNAILSPDQTQLVSPAVDFYYYGCGRDQDRGWGCAYRSLQSLLSQAEFAGVRQAAAFLPNSSSNAFHHREEKEPPREQDGGWMARARNPQYVDSGLSGNSADSENSEAGLQASFYSNGMASIQQLQLELASVGALQPEDVGSQVWIEPHHAFQYVTKYMEEPATLNDYDLKDPVSSKELLQQMILDIWRHFREYATPVMIDDSTYNFTVVGISSVKHPNPEFSALSPENVVLLRFDPHLQLDSSLSRFMYGAARDGIVQSFEEEQSQNKQRKNNKEEEEEEAQDKSEKEEEEEEEVQVPRPYSDPADPLDVGPGVKWLFPKDFLLGKKWSVLFPEWDNFYRGV